MTPRTGAAKEETVSGGGALKDSPPASMSTSLETTSGWVVARSRATAPPSDAPTSTTGLPYRVRVRVRVRDRVRVRVRVRIRVNPNPNPYP